MNLENMMKENPEALVVNVGGVIMADSLGVAEKFGKKHKDVLEATDKLVYELAKQSAENYADYFQESTYQDGRNRTQRRYLYSRDGFSLLVMGFTGPAALHWKLLYIEAFNKMEAALKTQPLDMEAVIAGVTDRVARKLIPAIFEQLEGRITVPAVVDPQEPVNLEGTGREHNSRRLDFLYGNEEALPNFLTVYDLRDFLGIGQRQAYELIKAEDFPKKKLGNAYRIPKKDFLEWLSKQ